MIPVEKAPKPKDFDERVRKPGLRAIDEMLGRPPRYPRAKGKPFKRVNGAKRPQDIPADRLPSYWTRALPDLMTGYRQVCAYSCLRIHPVTGAQSVDHFAAKSKRWDKIYTWSNYRLCCSMMNAGKREFSDVLDPFEVEHGWFQLELVGFQVVADLSLPLRTRKKVDSTIERLALNRTALRRAREHDAERYWARDVSLRVLREESPFVALELHRQGRLNSGDSWR